ncbi:MAG: hypothetical protein RLZZ618_3978 [Pseudomonadota bacterium]|jgi:Rad3-related DNA helicase
MIHPHLTSAEHPYTVAVRALCEFTAKQGDLDLRFTPSPTAQEGIAGHATVASRRSASYQAEVPLSGHWQTLTVRGRADGFDASRQRLEEIKTYRGDFARVPDNHRQLHWAQAKVYGHLLCEQLHLEAITLALVYFNVATQQETVLEAEHSAASLAEFFGQLCSRFLAWSQQESAHRLQRNEALTALVFLHPDFRPGQRELAEAVYRGARSGRCVVAQAPTGIGKTVGTLFPLLKSAPGEQLDKVFFLAAKTSGRALALDALAHMQRHTPSLPLRVLELVARDKACEYPDRACHGDSCPLARGFYDRLGAAREAALHEPVLDKAHVREVALAHQVCPYYLSQEMVRWADVVVGDYNYYFDHSALLHGLTQANDWRVGVLVDEAHNLVDRARRMYSAELRQSDLTALRAQAPASLKRALDRLNRCWNTLHKEQDADYAAAAAVPDKLLQALALLITALGEHLAEDPAQVDAPLLGFYFTALQFTRLAEVFGTHSVFDITLEPTSAFAKKRQSVLCIRNVVPGPFLTPRHATARSMTLFSATLRPQAYHADMLGLPENTAWVDVASPFEAHQLDVHIARRISTRYTDRTRSIAPIVALMAQQYAERPGNYLAFFSSYDYLQKVADALAAQHPDLPQWRQSARMPEAERDAFLQRFTPDGQGIGFAVLGGAFSEGIDLPGSRLVGAFIATLGLPQVNPVNEQMRERLEASFGRGYDYAYFYPGMQKVVQAAGRVIRTTEDRGVVHLMDDRFLKPAALRLLPTWWEMEPPPR